MGSSVSTSTTTVSNEMEELLQNVIQNSLVNNYNTETKQEAINNIDQENIANFDITGDNNTVNIDQSNQTKIKADFVSILQSYNNEEINNEADQAEASQMMADAIANASAEASGLLSSSVSVINSHSNTKNTINMITQCVNEYVNNINNAACALSQNDIKQINSATFSIDGSGNNVNINQVNDAAITFSSEISQAMESTIKAASEQIQNSNSAVETSTVSTATAEIAGISIGGIIIILIISLSIVACVGKISNAAATSAQARVLQENTAQEVTNQVVTSVENAISGQGKKITGGDQCIPDIQKRKSGQTVSIVSLVISIICAIVIVFLVWFIIELVQTKNGENYTIDFSAYVNDVLQNYVETVTSQSLSADTKYNTINNVGLQDLTEPAVVYNAILANISRPTTSSTELDTTNFSLESAVPYNNMLTSIQNLSSQDLNNFAIQYQQGSVGQYTSNSSSDNLEKVIINISYSIKDGFMMKGNNGIQLKEYINSFQQNLDPSNSSEVIEFEGYLVGNCYGDIENNQCFIALQPLTNPLQFTFNKASDSKFTNINLEYKNIPCKKYLQTICSCNSSYIQTDSVAYLYGKLTQNNDSWEGQIVGYMQQNKHIAQYCYYYCTSQENVAGTQTVSQNDGYVVTAGSLLTASNGSNGLGYMTVIVPIYIAHYGSDEITISKQMLDQAISLEYDNGNLIQKQDKFGNATDKKILNKNNIELYQIYSNYYGFPKDIELTSFTSIIEGVNPSKLILFLDQDAYNKNGSSYSTGSLWNKTQHTINNVVYSQWDHEQTMNEAYNSIQAFLKDKTNTPTGGTLEKEVTDNIYPFPYPDFIAVDEDGSINPSKVASSFKYYWMVGLDTNGKKVIFQIYLYRQPFQVQTINENWDQDDGWWIFHNYNHYEENYIYSEQFKTDQQIKDEDTKMVGLSYRVSNASNKADQVPYFQKINSLGLTPGQKNSLIYYQFSEVEPKEGSLGSFKSGAFILESFTQYGDDDDDKSDDTGDKKSDKGSKNLYSSINSAIPVKISYGANIIKYLQDSYTVMEDSYYRLMQSKSTGETYYYPKYDGNATTKYQLTKSDLNILNQYLKDKVNYNGISWQACNFLMNTQMQQEIVEGSRKNTSSYFKKYQEILGKDNDGNTIYSIDDKEVIEGIMTDVDNYEDGLLDYMKSIYTEEQLTKLIEYKNDTIKQIYSNGIWYEEKFNFNTYSGDTVRDCYLFYFKNRLLGITGSDYYIKESLYQNNMIPDNAVYIINTQILSNSETLQKEYNTAQKELEEEQQKKIKLYKNLCEIFGATGGILLLVSVITGTVGIKMKKACLNK